MDHIVDSIRKAFVPVRHEGYPFLIIAGIAAILLGLLWQPLFWFCAIVTGWIAYFFRDPPRVSPQDPALVLSPADGVIAAVATVMPPADLGLPPAPVQRVSVFMNVFNCHVNRAPVAGSVVHIAYRPGKFVNADLDKASEDNERNGIAIDSAYGRVGVVQIAGFVARRILCWVAVGEQLAGGQRIGMIRFGSRLDVYLPPGASVVVAEGQTAVAGETVIARFGGPWPASAVRVD